MSKKTTKTTESKNKAASKTRAAKTKKKVSSSAKKKVKKVARPEPLIILETPVEAGQSIQIDLALARLHTRTSIKVPVIVSRGKKEGPAILLCAGIHGDEINGVEIVRQLIEDGANKPDAGTIICIPVLNVFGYLYQNRAFPDGKDLNRSFPGSARGSLASRFAHFLMEEIIPHVDYVLDFHTGGDLRFNYSQLRIDCDDEVCMEAARAFGSKFVMHAKTRDRSLRQAASSAGKRVLLFEGGKTLYLDRNVTKAGYRGSIRVMHQLGLRDFSKEIESFPPPENPIVIRKSSWIRARYSGLFRSHASTGSWVEKGQKMGSITDPYGNFQRAIKAPREGYVLCTNHSPIVNQGDALFHLTKDHKHL